MFISRCSADHEQDWQPYPVDPYSATCVTIHGGEENYNNQLQERTRTSNVYCVHSFILIYSTDPLMIVCLLRN